MLVLRLTLLVVATLVETRPRFHSPLRAASARARVRCDDRGDVPGWVLITVMTAGLVTVLWQLAGPKLSDMLDSALSSVTGG